MSIVEPGDAGEANFAGSKRRSWPTSVTLCKRRPRSLFPPVMHRPGHRLRASGRRFVKRSSDIGAASP